MNHRFLKVAAVAGVLALVVLFASAPAPASNMGFKLERTVTTVDTPTPYLNLYYIALPFFRSVPDWVGTDPGGTIILPPDGKMSADDLLVDFFVKSHPAGTDLSTLGSMQIQCFDNTTGDEPAVSGGTWNADNSFYVRTIFCTGATEDTCFVAGTVPDFYVDEVNSTPWRGYQLFIAKPDVSAPAVSHDLVIVGSHNPAITQADLRVVNGYLNDYIISVPYHTTWVDSDEILCNVWNATFGGNCDADPGDPSVSFQLQSFDNQPGPPVNQDNSFYFRQVLNAFGTMVFVGNGGSPYAVTPGESYEFLLADPPGLVPGNTFHVTYPHY